MALRLIITQGPRQGETLEFPPHSTVRIGRLVRGNSFAIKDSGISSKHLTIETVSGNWLLRDLGSSNGTFLNGHPVGPDIAAELSSGDVVKLGELTSISVEIVDADDEPSRRRRNPRREASPPAPEVEVPRRGTTRRARVSSYKAEEGCSTEAQKVEGDERIPGSKRSGNEDIAVAGPVLRVSSRRTRKAKNEENLVSGSVLGKILENSGLEDGDGKVEIAKKAKRSTRRRQNLQQEPPELVLIDVEEEIKAGADEAVDRIENETENGNACGAAESSEAIEKADGSGLKESSEGVVKELDLEKMTLREWFDYLEVDFRRQIFEATEETIKGLRLKAERVREYVVQQKNEKATVSVV